MNEKTILGISLVLNALLLLNNFRLQALTDHARHISFTLVMALEVVKGGIRKGAIPTLQEIDQMIPIDAPYPPKNQD